ncbi:DNA topoisomerase IB [Leucobacter sp. GX24907]
MAERDSGRRTARRRPRRRLSIAREVDGDGFVYRLDGRKITRRSEIERIDALAIPPAWTDVEISRSRSAKELARGTDAAGRRQVLYHPSFRRRQDRRKFERLERFGRALPKLRAQVDRDLRRRRLSSDRIAACVVHLIDLSFFRVGNPEYASRYRSYGATTLRREHVRVEGSEAVFDFPGKSGKRHRRRVRDPRVLRLLARLRDEVPGPELFRFLDDEGEAHDLRSGHVNAYVKRCMGDEFTAKDFRTWGGTVVVATALLDADPERFETSAGRAQVLREAVRAAAAQLGNTAAVTKSSYVDPRVLDAAEHPEVVKRVRAARTRMRPSRSQDIGELSALALLTRMGRRSRRR